MIDCVLMDLDGTTMTKDNLVPDNLSSLIRKRDQMHWIMVTGRSFASATRTPLAKLFSKETPHIFDGGATVMSLDGVPIHQRYLSPVEIDVFINSINTEDLEYIYSCVGTVGGICWMRASYTNPELHIVKRTNDLAEYGSWIKSENVSKISVRKKNDFLLPDAINHFSNGTNIDITTASVDKGSGAKFIFEMLGIDPRKSIFLFNDKNDLPIINNIFFADVIKIKVGDSMPDIAADHNPSHPSDVAELLQKFI